MDNLLVSLQVAESTENKLVCSIKFVRIVIALKKVIVSSKLKLVKSHCSIWLVQKRHDSIVKSSSLCLRMQYLIYSICLLSINTLAPGRCGCNFQWVILKQIKCSKSWTFSMKSSSNGCHRTKSMRYQHKFSQATSHYLTQLWPSSMSPYDVIRL